jgi:hypothetical protein
MVMLARFKDLLRLDKMERKTQKVWWKVAVLGVGFWRLAVFLHFLVFDFLWTHSKDRQSRLEWVPSPQKYYVRFKLS